MNYRPALDKARRDFARKDPAVMARDCGALWDAAGKKLRLDFLNETVEVSYPDGSPRPRLIDPHAILVLHYLARAGGVRLAGRRISFKEVPGGEVYLGPYYHRVLRPLATTFGARPELFARAVEALGGEGESLGDLAATFRVLPRFPVTAVIWLGDDEIAPSATVLYDATAPVYLPTEDVVVAASALVYALLAAVR